MLEATLSLAREARRDRRAEGIAASAARLAASLIQADRATLGLVRGDTVEIVAVEPPPRPGSRFPLGYGLAGWVAATGQAAEVADVAEDRRYVAQPYPQPRAVVAVPLDVDGRRLGVLTLSWFRPSAFAPGSASALAPLAEHTALLLAAALGPASEAARLEEVLHDLKAPTHAVAGLLDLVLGDAENGLSGPSRELLEAAHSEAARLRVRIGALLEAGRETFGAERTMVQACDLLHEAAERARAQALAARVALDVEAEADLPPVLADAEGLLSALGNLVENALRAAPAGTAVLLRAAATPEGVEISVADRGAGLPDGDPSRLFERRVQGGTPDHGAGQVGLGLWIARRAVERHGGRMWAQNRPGGGARVGFTLPPG